MKKNDYSGIPQYLGNPGYDREERRKLLQYSIGSKTEESRAVQDFVLDACEKVSARDTAGEDEADYRKKIIELENGPARPAAFLGFISPAGSGAHRRGLVVFEDGSEAVPCVSDELAARLTCGQSVLVDPKARLIIAQDGNRPFAGEIATFERSLSPTSVLVRLSNDERVVLHMASALQHKIGDGIVVPGALLIANVRQHVAYCDVPQEQDGMKHFRHLDRSPLGDVAREDVAAANPIIQDMCEFIEQEMESPEIRRKYALPRSFLSLLIGPPGTGKTYTIQAIEREMYLRIRQRLGDMGEVPRRSFTLTNAEVISKWLGDSEKALTRFANEVFELARTPVKAADGREHLLPVLAMIEEADAICRRRSDGEFDGGAMDRILSGTFLQLFDPSRREFRDSMIIVLCTSNRPQGIDPAALRRLGMRTYHFHRIDRRATLEAVLRAQLKRTPVASQYSGIGMEQVVDEVAAWLYATQEQDPILDLCFVGSNEVTTKFRRHFLSHALVNRSVHAAASAACARELQGLPGGLQAIDLMNAIDAQVRSVAETQITVDTVREHLDIPDGLRVAVVKRHQKPVVARFQALRAAPQV
jgi:ATP-dependent 26S proteasome regulatory subunit